MRTPRRSNQSLVGSVLNVVLLLVAARMLFGVDGIVWRRWVEHQEARAVSRALDAAWPALVEISSPLDTAATPELIVFSDYQCPFCRQSTSEVLRLARAGRGVRLAHFPLSAIHPFAMSAAIAATCAAEQGRLTEVHEVLFRIETWDTEPDWRSVATRGGVRNLDAFDACRASKDALSLVRRGVELAKDLGIDGTPTWVTRAEIVSGYAGEGQISTLLGIGVDSPVSVPLPE